MDSILFVIALLCLALVVGWYVGNEATNGAGAWGLLAILTPKPAESTAQGPRYQRADRVAPGARAQTVLEKSAAADAADKRPRFAERGAGRFINRDESGYRIRGRLPMASDPPRRDGAPE
jgi:hypothetical protein